MGDILWSDVIEQQWLRWNRCRNAGSAFAQCINLRDVQYLKYLNQLQWLKNIPRSVNFYFHTVALQPNSRSRHPSTSCLVKTYRGAGTSPGSTAPGHHLQPAPKRTHTHGPVPLLHVIKPSRNTRRPSRWCKYVSCQYGSYRRAAADILGIKCACNWFPWLYSL